MSFAKYVPAPLRRLLKRAAGIRIMQDMPLPYREKELKKRYRQYMGTELDLEAPKLFTEKVQWLKLYGTIPAMKRCIDKREFKTYIR